ncbi:hypothetical protein HUK48_10620 [Prevotella corporis]|uniref:hypothetical protein n=1 Tax=Prevotella corporis TaxID=28128 RepID=UPI0027E537B4|nr:hypothetical protein [Prevotella corporis]MDQ7737813.1 hypothetical protein [Prevotella corporis]
MKKKELQLKRLYEKPECGMLTLWPSASILAGSGPDSNVGLDVDPWDVQEPENPGGTSEEQDELPDWLKP